MRNGRLRNSKKIDFFKAIAFTALFAAATALSAAQTADRAWLREPSPLVLYGKVIALGNNPIEQSAVQELSRSVAHSASVEDASMRAQHEKWLTVIGTAEEVRRAYPHVPVPSGLAPGEYWIWGNGSDERPLFVIAGGDERGALYGVFALCRYPLSGMTDPPEKLPSLHAQPLRSHPAMPIRWTDEWDCMCNDRCPKCSCEIEPYDSVEIGPPPIPTS